MSEVVHNAHHEFWRPPVTAQHETAVPNSLPAMVEACDFCGTEFMVGARFCYVCGGVRQAQTSPTAARAWMRYLEFPNIKRAIGLPTASLVAFLLGIGCLLAAIAVGAIYAVQNFTDFQAIQYWRIQWLLAAGVAFVAGILLKRGDSEQH